MPSKKSSYKVIRLPSAKGKGVYLRPNPPADENKEPFRAVEEAEAEIKAFAQPLKEASKAHDAATELHRILVAWNEPEANLVGYLLPQLEARAVAFSKLYWEAWYKRARLAEKHGLPQYRPEPGNEV